MDSPFVTTIYGPDFTRRGWVGDYEQLVATPRHNAVPTLSLTVAADHPRLPQLLADGARVTVDYRTDPADPNVLEQVFSGPLTAEQGTFPTSTSTVTLTGEGDLGIFGQVLGWPVPAAGIGAQSAAAYDVRTGPAETVIKGYAAANMVSRLGLPITVAPDLVRGATVKAQARMDVLRDLLFPLATAAGLGISVVQQGAGLVLDVYVPTVRARVLTEDSGVLVGGNWTRTRASATDVIVGGQGEGTARTFRLVRDTGLATAIGTRLEVFTDATDLTTTADLDARAGEKLAEGAPAAGISLQLAETSTWRYGRTVRVGDVVTVQLATGVTTTDVVGQVVLSHSKQDGLVVSPRVGDESANAEPNAMLARALARVAATVRRINTRR